MRLCASLVALLFYTGSTYSQSISVELSVRWIKGVDIFNRDSIIYYPELIITYRNNSDTSYYFSKVSENDLNINISNHTKGLYLFHIRTSKGIKTYKILLK